MRLTLAVLFCFCFAKTKARQKELADREAELAARRLRLAQELERADAEESKRDQNVRASICVSWCSATPFVNT